MPEVRPLLLRAMIAVNVVTECAVLVHDLAAAGSRAWGRCLGAIALTATALLLLVSVASFRTHRRIAVVGLWVAFAGLVIGLLSPEL